MSSEVLLVVAAPAALLVLLLLLFLIGLPGRGSGKTPAMQRRSRAMREREAAMAAQVAVEEHDIEEMLEAQRALRRRTGRPSIGDELVDEALDPRRDDPA